MKGLITGDVEKLRSAEPGPEKYMILVIDSQPQDNSLGKWLSDYRPQHVKAFEEVSGGSFTARIWLLE